MPCFDLKPASIIKTFKTNSTYVFRNSSIWTIFYTWVEIQLKKQLLLTLTVPKKQIDIETFTWEKLDCIDEVKLAFGL